MANDYSGNTRADLVATAPADTDSIGEVGAALRQIKRVITDDAVGIMSEVNAKDATNLLAAKDYADQKDGDNLTTAKAYTDSSIETALMIGTSIPLIGYLHAYRNTTTATPIGSVAINSTNFPNVTSFIAGQEPFLTFNSSGILLKAGKYIITHLSSFCNFPGLTMGIDNFFGDSKIIAYSTETSTGRLIGDMKTTDSYRNVYPSTAVSSQLVPRMLEYGMPKLLDIATDTTFNMNLWCLSNSSSITTFYNASGGRPLGFTLMITKLPTYE